MGLVAAATGVRAGTDGSGEIKEPGSTRQVPAVWIEFGRRLQERIQQCLSSDSEAVMRLQTSMQNLATERGASPTVIVRVWVHSDGAVARAELEGPSSAEDRRDLMLAIGDAGVDETVPPEMPQPLRMKFTLAARPTEQSR
ncbi:hypothetical protein SR870_04150 [Rhodopseudomonas palustris]|uniref:hypothetical protein n=1 Tax=Rhodopseudomonas palustris TaxID=1076 RepID=UPI002ACEF810|nr:hypothetical protein [Rhodopseudomonas palustris]WQH00497.1 hypothetical protein SR870_04150 [Rhodopseudomonas palustris]